MRSGWRGSVSTKSGAHSAASIHASSILRTSIDSLACFGSGSRLLSERQTQAGHDELDMLEVAQGPVLRKRHPRGYHLRGDGAQPGDHRARLFEPAGMRVAGGVEAVGHREPGIVLDR